MSEKKTTGTNETNETNETSKAPARPVFRLQRETVRVLGVKTGIRTAGGCLPGNGISELSR
jgi:hypothetical protein